MPKPLTASSVASKSVASQTVASQPAHPLRKTGQRQRLLLLGLVASLAGNLMPSRVCAETPETAPAQLREALAQIDAAANSRNLKGVMDFYSTNFTHTDGLTRQTLEQSLTKLWERYPNIQYRTEIKSWKAQGNGFTTETVTRITGTQKQGDRQLQLESTLKSQQQFENQKIVRQEVLAERSQITSGNKPPTVKLTLPEQVAPGQSFSFDAVVQEPLGNDLLLGTALEEPIRVEGVLNPTIADLELLSAGGIFKMGRAPLKAGNRWISAVLVRQEGMTIITQRLRVVPNPKPTVAQ